MPSEFQQQVYAIVAQIPRGKVVTYGQIAGWLGQPRAARQVGYAMAACPRDMQLPWQRVVNAQGQVSKRANPEDEELQRARLESEGIVFDAAGRIPLAQYQWWPDG